MDSTENLLSFIEKGIDEYMEQEKIAVLAYLTENMDRLASELASHGVSYIPTSRGCLALHIEDLRAY